MKQKDIFLIIIVTIVSVAVAVIISKALITAPSNRQQKVEVVQPISSNFSQPDNKYFNDKSIDPAQRIQIGNNSNKKPFTGSGN